MRIGWVVDHPKRDLAGSVLAAYQLASRGASVAIIPMYEQGVDVPRLGLDTLVANYARAANLDLMRSFAAAGLGALCSRHRRRRAGGKRRQFAARHGRLCPRQRYTPISCRAISSGATGCMTRSTITRRCKPEQLHLTGCPRFDFAAPQLASAARRRAARLSARQRQFSAGEFPLLQQAGRRARNHDPGRMGRRLYRSFPRRS